MGLEFSEKIPTSRNREDLRLISSPMAYDIAIHTCVMKPPLKIQKETRCSGSHL
jgi:hypothetical protein